MTSGQGSGPDGGQGGPPPYGQPPYGGPPSGPPPYPSVQPPYGEPPYGRPGQGYLPAPTAPTGWGPDAPKPVERPVTVRAGLGAFVATLVLGLVSYVVMLMNWDTVLATVQAQAGAGAGDVPFDEEAAAELILRITIVVGLVFTALFVLFLWFAWKGYNWARIVLWVLGGLNLLSGLAGQAGGSGVANPFPFVTALGWFQLLFIAVGIVLLATKPSSEWYRYRRWVRATGQGS